MVYFANSWKFRHVFQILIIFLFFCWLFISPASAATISNVPFSSQAPLGNWKNQRLQDGCEESSALMAMLWVKGEKSITPKEAEKKIIAISDFEQKKYGEYRDVSLPDMLAWIFKDYYHYDKAELKKNISLKEIIKAIESGQLVLVPANGRLLKNPHYTAPGPERHMLLIIGYDAKKKQFITNDPGTRYGASYRYSEAVLYKAIRAYPTGYHKKINQTEKSAIIVSK